MLLEGYDPQITQVTQKVKENVSRKDAQGAKKGRDGGWRTEVGGQRTDDRRQGSEVRSQGSEKGKGVNGYSLFVNRERSTDFADFADKRVVVVTHVAIIRMLMLYSEGRDLNEYKKVPVPGNGEVFDLADGSWLMGKRAE